MKLDFAGIYGKEQRQYEFVLNDEGEPIKIGDGTFGCVFHVQDASGEHHALKLFYKPNDKFIEASHEGEIHLRDDLQHAFKNEVRRVSEVGRYLVVGKAYVDDFFSTSAYKELKSYFDARSLPISKTGIVMDIYPATLKDVLERGWQGANPPRSPGYSILRSLSQTEREKCILPLVAQLAQALSTLHDANYNHQDIKPANVFFRVVGPEIQVALGDLGFVNVGQFQAPGTEYRIQPLGTRHYRSPEQTDFVDVCEVDVRPLEDGNYELKTHDPKFRETFAEPGDLVVFSKLHRPIQWPIESIDFNPEKTSDSTNSVVAKIQIRGLPSVNLVNDVRTQISIYKKQTARTDLFGLGAITFDMLTCGRSAERFYDLLRVHDRAGAGSIASGLGQMYRNYRNGGGAIPEVEMIFRSMRVDDNSDLPDPDLVDIVFRAMMSQPPDSYWQMDKWGGVNADLEAMIARHNCAQYDGENVNHLTTLIVNEEGYRPPTKLLPEKDLSQIQGLSYSDKVGGTKRLILGVRYLTMVANMLKAELGDGDDVAYLANVSPRSLTQRRGAFETRHILFSDSSDFNAVFESGNPQNLMQVFPGGSLRPPFVDGLVKEGEIWLSPGNSKSGKEGKVSLGYELWNATGFADDDRWRLLLDIPKVAEPESTSGPSRPTDVMERLILSITKIDSNILYLSDDDGAVKEAIAKGRHRAYFVKEFDRSQYYLAMLGVFLRLVFFVEGSMGQAHTPPAIHFFQHGLTLGRASAKPLDIVSPSRRSGRNLLRRVSPSERLFSLMAGIYMRLLTGHTPVDMLPEDIIDSYVDQVTDAVRGALDCHQHQNLIGGSVDSLAKECNGFRPLAEFPNIDQLASANIVMK